MPTTINTVTINADADDVWAVLADLTATRQWLPGVVSARMRPPEGETEWSPRSSGRNRKTLDGTVRVCTMADGQEVHERISDVSPQRRSYRFRHLRVPLPVRDSGGSFTVTPATVAGTATVTLQTTFEPLDPTAADEVTAMIRGAFQQSLESLRRYVEEKVAWDAH